MKNKYGIGFFAAAIIAVLAVSSAYQLSYQKAKERAQTQVTKEQEEPATSKSEPTVSADGQALKEDCYYLMEVNGYVVVYLSDKKTAYEYTDILYDNFRQHPGGDTTVKYMGKARRNIYGFLENYSS